MRKYLNLGSGAPDRKTRTIEWINFDISKIDTIDIRGDAFQLPFKDNTFEMIHCIHMLEHVWRDQQVAMLAEAKRVLKPGAKLYIEVPDFKETVIRLARWFKSENQDRVRMWDLMVSIYGKTDSWRKAQAHKIGFDEQWLREKFIAAGFEKMERSDTMVSEHWRGGPVLLMVAEK